MKKYFLNPEVNQINLFNERWYRIKAEDGQEHILPSVTTYLSAFPKGLHFEKWLAESKDPFKMRDEAAQMGSEVHGMIERTFKGETIEFVEGQINLETWEKYLSFCKFWRDFNINPAECLWTKVDIKKNNIKIVEVVAPVEFTEFITFDIEERTAGTVDKVLKLIYEDGKIEYAILDWKSGNYVGDTAYLQTAAYAHSVAKQIGYPIDRTIIVQLGLNLNRDGYKTFTHSGVELVNDFIDFNHTKAVWLRDNKNEAPKFKSYPIAVNLEYIKNNEIIKVS